MKVALEVHSSGGTDTSPKLAKAAREFEAILLESWLEKMNKSFAGDGDHQDAAHDTISSMGAQAVAGALAERGGVGIASMMMERLGPKAVRTEQDSRTLKSSHNLPIR